MAYTYTQRHDGEWVDVTAGRVVACCDCGLIHEEEYCIVNNMDGTRSILNKAYRNNRRTAGRRLSLKAKKEGLWEEKKL